MISKILIGIAIVLGVYCISSDFGLRSASACNRTAGCVMDSFQESYDMMHSGKMTEAMIAGQDNVEAFRRLQAQEQARAAGVYQSQKK
jgi:hypothetical protein